VIVVISALLVFVPVPRRAALRSRRQFSKLHQDLRSKLHWRRKRSHRVLQSHPHSGLSRKSPKRLCVSIGTMVSLYLSLHIPNHTCKWTSPNDIPFKLCVQYIRHAPRKPPLMHWRNRRSKLVRDGTWMAPVYVSVHITVTGQHPFPLAAMKRSTSSRTTELTEHISAGRLLPEPEDVPGPRRSKRVKHVTGVVPVLEEIVQGSKEPDLSHVSFPSRPSKTVAKSTKTHRKFKVTQQLALGAPHPAPARWREAYDMITNMRLREIADVDTMGCQLAQEGEADPVVSDQIYYTLHQFEVLT